MQIKSYITQNYPTLPSSVTLPIEYEENEYYIIIPDKTRYNRYDFPFICADVSPNCVLNQPVYHKGFILLQGRHNGRPAVEIDQSVFDYANSLNVPEHMSLRKIMEIILSNKDNMQNIESLVNVCANCPDMLDLALDNGFGEIFYKNRGVISTSGSSSSSASPNNEILPVTTSGQDYLRSFIDMNYKFVLPNAYSTVKEFYESNDSLGLIVHDTSMLKIKNFDNIISSLVYKLCLMDNFYICCLLVSDINIYKSANSDLSVIPEHIEIIPLNDNNIKLGAYYITRDYAEDYVNNDIDTSYGWATSYPLALPDSRSDSGPTITQYFIFNLNNYNCP